ncbi:uncharacterized protein ColSpa_10881 [Colletotrichum spaethianum]|uniref:Uncharacterized protein n=1 Tax=Colletotrichum spaethianum TaxID=700344 RepID=A0AA37UPH8_9PEZI|nr:uncharacterized protein ColSpa_10881 [Colletotrichum spaethianum]GKT50700.1 hypothetical protein ColSpa_10881 [Colletotrichum spaethianum]
MFALAPDVLRTAPRCIRSETRYRSRDFKARLQDLVAAVEIPPAKLDAVTNQIGLGHAKTSRLWANTAGPWLWDGR